MCVHNSNALQSSMIHKTRHKTTTTMQLYQTKHTWINLYITIYKIYEKCWSEWWNELVTVKEMKWKIESIPSEASTSIEGTLEGMSMSRNLQITKANAMTIRGHQNAICSDWFSDCVCNQKKWKLGLDCCNKRI